jgi:hypothetical protein
MLSIERFSCKGVNPFLSHLHDKKVVSPPSHVGTKKPVLKPAF